MPKSVLVSDFDGTMTENEFYLLVAKHLLPPDALRPWEDYRAGKITHFKALQSMFGRIRATPEQLDELVKEMRPDPGLGDALKRLRQAGWEVVVASAGCDWYIRRVLALIGVEITVFSNPGVHVLPEGYLRMDPPEDSPFYCAGTGIDKAAVVRFHRDAGAKVAFAGDGYADLPAALETPAGLRFARGVLAQVLGERGEAFRAFGQWSEIAAGLLSDGGSS